MFTFVKGQAFLWPEESAVTVISANKITDPEPDSLQLQQDCSVKVGRSVYSGKVAPIGKYFTVSSSPYYMYSSVRRKAGPGASMVLL